MFSGLPPPPTRAANGDFAWTAWYNQLYKLLSTTGSLAWSLVDKAGSSIADLANHAHDLLTGLQGGITGEHYHLTAAEHSALSIGGTVVVGGVAYGTGTGLGYTAVGTTGYFLKSGGTGTPTWSNSIGGYVVDNTTPYLDWSDGSAVTLAAGRMWYNGSAGSWNLGMGGGNITQQVGEELFIYGKASAAITEGQLICKTGTVGASGVITFGPSPTGLVINDGIIGVATENIALNSFGRITQFGVVRGITTNGTSVGEVWADNDTLYYNPAYAGGMTKVKPSSPYTKFEIATVIKAGGGGSGSIQVDLIHGTTLGGGDSNVQLGTLVNGDSLIYDTTLGYWVNRQASALSGFPITKTANFTINPGEVWFINNKTGSACTVTFPLASAWPGRTVTIKNMQAQLVNSASSNIVPLDSTTAGTAILLGVVGNWATMVSDGTNWVIMQAAPNNILLLE